MLGLDDLHADRGLAEVIGPGGEVLGMASKPIAVVSDNGPCFRGEVFKSAFAGPDPLLRHVRTRVRSPQTNGVIERWFGTLKYEHLFRGVIFDGDALDMEVHRFRIIYNTIRPHQAIDDRTPGSAFISCEQRKIDHSIISGGGRSPTARPAACECVRYSSNPSSSVVCGACDQTAEQRAGQFGRASSAEGEIVGFGDGE
ncbi:integrase core domain-containing protein [Nocardia africana]|uniref:Integrase core domain-containing protein n=1 Tax=Nocardia africana TaxID=134964 RepID=A0ABW6NS71_9NOCA